ncbi:Undecaprenyl-phosphate mannosyltransferase [Pseudoalteromonas sp. P1-9]|uniref:glycosyltransferase family 2 protein n=1 Tax=Pseudoalteromonas sp. P1-9 TaxID=1710354 RepID=UPI0006D5F71F|nr:glycosyltransferase family 2 protein [Pseudoalteromonas sp. P1-9]KPV96570.1 Undecaprenyl-phosphate mannosyltransferase [Pseudoalteromonas sp. P1-9]
MEDILVIIPAHNEESTIALVIEDLRSFGYHNILVVDDCSTDNTAICAKNSGVSVMSLPYNLGAWKATQAGLRYANKINARFAVTFDADQQHLAQEIHKLREFQKNEKLNIAIGSCLTRGSVARHMAWKFFRKLSGVKVQDLTSGLRLYDQKAIKVLSRKEASLLEYQDVGVLLLLRTFEITKGEVDVQMHDRTVGISRIFYSWWAVFYYMTYTTVLCLSKLAKTNKLISAEIKD